MLYLGIGDFTCFECPQSLDTLYGKIVRRTKKYAAHDERNACKIGDKVSIRECRPLSKSKHWEILAEAG